MGNTNREVLDTIPRFGKFMLSLMLERPDTWWLSYGMEVMRVRALIWLENADYVRRIHEDFDTHELTDKGRATANIIEKEDWTIEVKDGKWVTSRPQPAGEDLDHKYHGE